MVLWIAAAAVAQADVGAWVAELQRSKDDADPALIQKVADTKTRDAAQGLVKVYDAMASIYMRLQVLKALIKFDGTAESEQPAMSKIADVATSAVESELRDTAVDLLGTSAKLGKHFLKQIVDSDAPDAVRERAMRQHVRLGGEGDAEWYRFLWNPKCERRKDAEGRIQGMELNPIREMAFDALKARISEAELVETIQNMVPDADPKIRRAALAAMHDRNLPRTSDMATWLLERVDCLGGDRAEAARILAAREGAKAANVFFDLAKKRDVTTEDLRLEMARLIAALDDDSTNKKVAKLVGKGKPHERVFAIMASDRISDPKLVAAIRKELQDKSVEVRRAAGAALARRRDRDSLPDLRALLAKSKDPMDARIAIEAISVIEQRSDGWLKELTALAKHGNRDVRNAAVEQIGAAKDTAFLPALFEALEHDDWSTRLVAIESLGVVKDKSSVPRLIERLKKESGRLSKAIAESLWNLTAKPFEEGQAQWAQWWAAEGATFEVASTSDVEKAAKDREQKRLMARTASPAQFFGIRIESHRVIFIIDTSGSMLESVYGRLVGKRGAARIDVAKEELSTAIKNLAPNTLFNIFAFSSGFDRWLKTGIGDNSGQSRDSALEWVQRLGAAGATNLFDTVKAAFEDPDVDTIILLSDGEPTSGEILDPHRIREEVAFWNKHRHVKIHTVAVGLNLEVLEWLAADSGGSHVKIR
jgi:HEAT repeat protein